MVFRSGGDERYSSFLVVYGLSAEVPHDARDRSGGIRHRRL